MTITQDGGGDAPPRPQQGLPYTGGGEQKQKSRQDISTRGIMLSDSEAEAIMDAYENEDITEMTWTRQIVEKWLQGVR